LEIVDLCVKLKICRWLNISKTTSTSTTERGRNSFEVFRHALYFQETTREKRDKDAVGLIGVKEAREIIKKHAREKRSPPLDKRERGRVV
jgi:hypothetical protein